MVVAKKYVYGSVIVFVLASLITVMMLSGQVKLEVGLNDTKIYVNESGSFVLGGIEKITLEGYEPYKITLSKSVKSTNVTIIRTSRYNISGKIVTMTNKYYFDGKLTAKETFPIKETHTITDGKGTKICYDVKILSPKVKVTLHDGTTISKSSIYCYEVTKSSQTFNIRLFDPISIILNNTIPADLTVLNGFGSGHTLNYNLSNINTSTLIKYFNVTDSSGNCLFYFNGSGYQCGIQTHFESSVITENNSRYAYKDNMIYPATYLYNETRMENSTHLSQTLTGANNYAYCYFFNFSTNTTFNIKETMWISTSNQNEREYLCNSSIPNTAGIPDSGFDASTNANCKLVISRDIRAFNHTHNSISNHTLDIVSFNNSQYQGMKITPIMYSFFRGGTGGNAPIIYYIGNYSRIGQCGYTTDSGVTYVALAGTYDNHWHQYFGTEEKNDWLCGNDTDTGAYNCSTVNKDIIGLVGLNSVAIIKTPESGEVINGKLTSNYTINYRCNAINRNGTNATLNLYNSTTGLIATWGGLNFANGSTSINFSNISTFYIGDYNITLLCFDDTGSNGSITNQFSIDRNPIDIYYLNLTAQYAGYANTTDWAAVNVNNLTCNVNITGNATIPYFQWVLNNVKSDLDTGLVAWYRLNNETGENETRVLDWSGNGNNGTVVNATYNTSGKINGAYSFDGYFDYIQIPQTSPNYALKSPQNHTLVAWIRPVANGTTGLIVGGRRGDFTLLELGTSRKLIAREDDFTFTGQYVIPLNEWTHVAYSFTYGNTSNQVNERWLYVNGVLDTYDNYSGSDDFNVSNIFIGWESRFNDSFNGTIDEVRIYNRSLSTSEILDLYNLDKNTYNNTLNVGDNISVYLIAYNYTYSATSSKNITILQYRVINTTYNGDSFELGTSITINSVYNPGEIICLDVDDSRYGTNVSCGNTTLNYNLNITSFRKSTTNESNSTFILTYSAAPMNNTFYIKSHQFDTPLNLSFNISIDLQLSDSTIKFYINNTNFYNLSPTTITYFSDLTREKIITNKHNTTLVGYVSVPSTATITNFNLKIQGTNYTFFVPIADDNGNCGNCNDANFDSYVQFPYNDGGETVFYSYYNSSNTSITVKIGRSRYVFETQTSIIDIPLSCRINNNLTINTEAYWIPGSPAYGYIQVSCLNSTSSLINLSQYNTYIGDALYGAYMYDINATFNSKLSDVFVEIGTLDGVKEFNQSGIFNITNTTMDMSDAANDYLLTCTSSGGYCFIPIYVYSNTAGLFNISNINVSYTNNYNPIVVNLNITSEYLKKCDGVCNIPIKIESETNGTINISDIKYNYYGGNQNITITAHTPTYSANTTSIARIYYSGWNYSLPRFVDWIEFIPSTPTSKNVTPYGQQSNKPIFNITNLGYTKNFNFSMYQNETNSCVNITVSTSYNKSAGYLLSNAWTELYNGSSYLTTKGLWFWADFSCNQSSWRLWNPDWSFRACCDGCTCDTTVS
jgi:hypothetical protein